MSSGELRDLPRIDALVEALGDLVPRYGRGAVTTAVRHVVERERQVRRRALPGRTADELAGRARELLGTMLPGPPRRVINATGVIVHTNLGRAPLSAAALAAVAEAAGACDLEYDLDSGSRGSRTARLGPLIAVACGAEDGFAVNNAAGALVLALAALAHGRGVPVSRGELVEIGGSFRLPEIMGASGARLLEVGTTNRTRAADYRGDRDVGLLLKVHTSNYEVRGFAESPSVAELADVARELGVPLVHDVGSGLLADRDEPWLRDEPSMGGSLAAGADLVLCSGDKLLGGPQAGLLAGRRDLVEACRRHPLARALRLDKLRIAALVATLEEHLRGDLAGIPVWGALLADAGAVEARARRLAEAVGGEVMTGASVIGGGSAPGAEIPTPVMRVAAPQPDAVARHLRGGTPPIIVRVADGALWIDLRTIAEEDDDLVASQVGEALRACT